MVRKTGLELRTSGVFCGEERGASFPPLFCFLALPPSAFERISQAKPKTEVRVRARLREKRAGHRLVSCSVVTLGLELRTSGVRCFGGGA